LSNGGTARKRGSVAAAAVLFLSASAAFPAAAQAQAEGAGATIVLPHRLIAGQPATLAVLGADGRLLPGAAIEFTGGEQVSTDETGRATFTAPEQPGVLFVRLAGTNVGASATVFAAREDAPGGLSLSRYPRILALSDRFTLAGTGFRGEADRNRIQLGGQPAVVLAASPESLVALPSPRAARGPTELVVEVDGERAAPVAVTLVVLELASGRNRIRPGERAAVVVRVRGSEQRLELEARNHSPEVISLLGGDTLRVTTRGGSVNTAVVNVEGRRDGEFELRVRLMPPPAGTPDVEAVRRTLLEALLAAPPEWAPRVEAVVRMLDDERRDVRRVQLEIERMLADHPEGELGRKLEAAWRILLDR
jgi:hypothetical protein